MEEGISVGWNRCQGQCFVDQQSVGQVTSQPHRFLTIAVGNHFASVHCRWADGLDWPWTDLRI